LTVDTLSFETTDHPSPEACDVLRQGLRALNAPMLGPYDARPLGIFARADGALEGGLVGETGRGMLHVDLLWVHPERRGGGLGSRLIALAEAEARSRGCRGVWLDTYDFQARPFYERHGYRVFGELGGYPNGHVRYFLSKMF
jgi:GNAT superfamily N-acetyltransferase